jgi:hypothetical protein
VEDAAGAGRSGRAASAGEPSGADLSVDLCPCSFQRWSWSRSPPLRSPGEPSAVATAEGPISTRGTLTAGTLASGLGGWTAADRCRISGSTAVGLREAARAATSRAGGALTSGTASAGAWTRALTGAVVDATCVGAAACLSAAWTGWLRTTAHTASRTKAAPSTSSQNRGDDHLTSSLRNPLPSTIDELIPGTLTSVRNPRG